MTNKLALLLCLAAAACASKETSTSEQPEPLEPPEPPPVEEPVAVPEPEEPDLMGELSDAVAAELMRIDDVQFTLENELAGVRQDPDDVAWVQKKLANMVAVDQLLRNSMMLPAEKGWSPADAQAFMGIVGPRTIEVDERNTHELKALVERHGWFNVSTFGAEADRNAWLLVQHADRDPAFQKEVLTVLEDLVPLGETSPSNFAYLYDRVASAEGRPQRYGTQGRCIGTSWEPNPLEDPEAVDELRASVGLSSLAEYKAICSQMCR